MSTATSVPPTVGLGGDDAFETLRATGRRRLLLDAFDRFRAADGFSHARALAFQFALTLVPALILRKYGTAALLFLTRAARSSRPPSCSSRTRPSPPPPGSVPPAGSRAGRAC